MPLLSSGPTPRPWLASYADGVPPDIDLPEESLVDLLEASVARFGRLPALDFFGATTTYDELLHRVNQASAVLHDLGVAPGDRVALVLPNCPQHVVAFYAALRIGAVVVEHNPLYTPEELEHQLADHQPRVAVVWDLLAGTVLRSAARTQVSAVLAVNLVTALPRTKRWALRLPLPAARRARAALTGPAPGALRWDSQVAAADPLPTSHPRPRPGDAAVLLYTGGTTGTPKGAILTHRNLRANAAQGRAWVPGLLDGRETVYGVLPFFHAYGLTLCLTFTVAIGAVLVLFPRFDPEAVLAATRRRPPTFLPAVPPVYDRLAELASARGVDLRSVRVALSGAMALPPRTVTSWERVTGGLLVEGYGMTETSPVALGNPVAPSRRPGTVGVPFPSTQARVVDPDDPTTDRPPGVAGELLLRGPQVFEGYWRRPDETAEVLLPDGWLRTGDVVVMSEDGFFTVVDRLKEVIITGGFNVYPSEVEAVLRAVPGVADAAVVGLPTTSGSEEVTAAVVAEAGVQLDVDRVRHACREHLARYKVPRRVVQVDELPHSTIGKVRRREVRTWLAASEPAGSARRQDASDRDDGT